MIEEKVKEWDGKKFIVTIDRESMYRRYVLRTVEELGELIPQNEPLYREDFEKHYGFSPEWPHGECTFGADGERLINNEFTR